MATGISKAKGRRSSKSKARAGSRAKLGLPAKAGKRKAPINKSGAHITVAEDRDRAMWLNTFGVKPYERPIQWRAVNAR